MKHELYAPAASASTTKKLTRASQKDGTTISSVLSERPHTIGIVRMRAGRPDGLEHRLDGREGDEQLEKAALSFFCRELRGFSTHHVCVLSLHTRLFYL